MDDTNTNDIDLGSEPGEEFDPFPSDDELGEDETADNAATTSAQPPAETETKITQPKQTKTAAATSSNPEENEAVENPIEKAIGAAETKEAEKSRQSLYEKPPVFKFAGATETIEDSSQTFDELRIAKAGDFPELDDGKRVSWTIEYGKITKTVADPKGTSIAKMKTEIETSKAFLDALKKAKDKNPDCNVTPKVTAQSKGTKTAAGYKSVFTCMADVDAAQKVISILPAKDGNVYEIRRTEMGRFTTPTSNDNLLSDVRAGFARTLPLIPRNLLLQIISFFRYFTNHGANNEALLNIYWDKHESKFIVDAPEQVVTPGSVNSQINDKYCNERYIHYMDIHSHNSMRAFFSAVDNADEKATRLYAVVGELHRCIPDIKTRISNGGKFLEIEPGEIFEPIGEMFPDVWKETVRFRAPHDDTDEKEISHAAEFLACCSFGQKEGFL